MSFHSNLLRLFDPLTFRCSHPQITFNLGRFTDSIKGEWDSLRQHDIMFLLTIQAHDASGDRYKDDTEFRQHFGLKYVRGCEIADLIGSDGERYS
ncbi:hypothetical protein BC936DRAFT_148194 [Jimgerdemannia flammicorona]|uniref:RNA helicase aquarius beta-barrel domain-containing protein n=1 Tax=Jimgerdemannia flammicorona TaxID=994334 RepID=A0A433DNA3_9FUNG|nr:hypothetical protein BC936DRAFT_148194 [Jimgerdemannia flammicorona]